VLGTHWNPGNWANFAVLREKPLEDVRNSRTLQAVYIAGKPVPGVGGRGRSGRAVKERKTAGRTFFRGSSGQPSPPTSTPRPARTARVGTATPAVATAAAVPPTAGSPTSQTRSRSPASLNTT
jgi:hypothetical protein